jgi:hypothetical protein
MCTTGRWCCCADRAVGAPGVHPGGDLLNNFVFGAGRDAHPPVAVYNMISFDQLAGDRPARR